MNWQKATLMDRAIAMLLVFAGSVQISTGRGFLGDENGLVQPSLWMEFVCKMATSITGTVLNYIGLIEHRADLHPA